MIAGHIRRHACDELLKQVMINSAVQGGQEPPTKFRPAKDSDRYLVGPTVNVLFDEIKNDDEIVCQAHSVKMMWQTAGKALWIELSAENVQNVCAQIKHSKVLPNKPKKVKGSPKKRRLRRSKSNQANPGNGEEKEPEDNQEAADFDL